ncbi:hypothetical protein FQN49_000938 [Arthroderma sp. PD_2]|nr:hypothetical protein FQN49_000938 [Arthroderma sp. PD_2]
MAALPAKGHGNRPGMFGPRTFSIQRGARALEAILFNQKVLVYILPDNTGREDIIYWAIYLMFCGTCKTGLLENWKSWVASFACLITPSFAAHLTMDAYEKKYVPYDTITALRDAMSMILQALSRKNAEDVHSGLNMLQEHVRFDSLPTIEKGAGIEDTFGEWEGSIIVGYYAMILYLAGRRVEGPGRFAFTMQLPRELKRKMHIDYSAVSFYEGRARMSDQAHLFVNDAWADMGHLRSVVFTEYSKYDSIDTNKAQDIIWTAVSHFAYTDMEHVRLVHNFLTEFPWAPDVPCLRPAIEHFHLSVLAAEKMNDHVLRFTMVIYRERADIFSRQELEPLIACADAVKQGQLKAYCGDFKQYVAAFLEEKARHEAARVRKFENLVMPQSSTENLFVSATKRQSSALEGDAERLLKQPKT